MCLEAILQDVELPKKLPPSISGRMTIASVLSEHIKNLGYHGDMGYSTILYGSESEIRKILIFLIEKLPRDPLKTSVGIETSYVHSLLKEIDENVQLQLKHLWVPSNLLCKGIRQHSGNKFSIHSFGNSVPLISEPLIIPDAGSPQKGNSFIVSLNFNIFLNLQNQYSYLKLTNICNFFYPSQYFMSISYMSSKHL